MAENPQEMAREILPVNIEDELKQSYMDYAMSVIVGRALPDVRDGLKPTTKLSVDSFLACGTSGIWIQYS